MKQGAQHGNLKPEDLNPHILMHFGIPSTGSILAIDPIQQLLAIGTLSVHNLSIHCQLFLLY